MKCKFCTLSQALWLRLNVMALSSRLVALGCSPLLRQVKAFTQRLQISQFCFVCLFLAAVPRGPELVRLGHTWRGAKAFSRHGARRHFVSQSPPGPISLSAAGGTAVRKISVLSGFEGACCQTPVWDGMTVPKVSVVLNIVFCLLLFLRRGSDPGWCWAGAKSRFPPLTTGAELVPPRRG